MPTTKPDKGERKCYDQYHLNIHNLQNRAAPKGGGGGGEKKMNFQVACREVELQKCGLHLISLSQKTKQSILCTSGRTKKQ